LALRIRDLAKENFMIRLISKVLVPLVRLWFGTCRVEVINERVLREYILSGRPSVGGTWHRAGIYVLYYFGRLHPMIMISQSKDGEMLAHYAAANGVIPVRGSSSRGGRDALKRMRRHLANGGKACATVLDGPRGPAHVAKKGMLVLAKQSGAPLIPVIWSANRTITLRNSWDKTLVPLPWSRICLAIGDPIHIPEDSSNEDMERYRQLVEDRLNALMAVVDRRCGYRG
jgi:lysophospholipid acyltransferase (LPLAT)-like uncharacterized protein